VADTVGDWDYFPGIDALRTSGARCGSAPRRQASPQHGFVNRIYHDDQGDHRYVVFVPQNYAPNRAWPAILFLHGAGESGNDGLAPTTAGRGPYVKQRAATFPFIVIFPQCEDTMVAC